MMKQRIKILIASVLLLQVPLFAMEKRIKLNDPIPVLPQDMNWAILEQLIVQTDFADIPQALKSFALTSKENNNFINNPNTTRDLINLLNQRTKNKVRAAEIMHTAGAQKWLKTEHLKTDEGKKEFAQAREDEQKFIEFISAFNPNLGVNPNLEEIKKYITMGINVNAGDKRGDTALMWAASWGNPAIVKLLLPVPGININAVDKYGYTALDLATRNGNYKARELLQAVGAKTGAELKNK